MTQHARSSLLVFMAAVLATGCDRIAERWKDTAAGPDTIGGGDVVDPTPDTSEPVPPEATTLVDGVLVPPGGESPAAWRVMNRFGATEADASGAFRLPIADRGATFTIALPPATDPRTSMLIVVTARSAANEGEPDPTLRVDARSTAIGAVLVHDRVAPHAPWRLVPLAELAGGLTAIDALTKAIELTFDQDWTTAALTREAYRVAVTDLLRRAAPAWEATLATDVPAEPEGGPLGGPEGVRVVRPLGATPLAALTRTVDGMFAVVPLPGRPPIVRASVEPLDAGSVGLGDVLTGVAAPALGPATDHGMELDLDEGLYRVVLTADVDANEALVRTRHAALVTGDTAGAVGPDDVASPRLLALVDVLASVTPGAPLVADPDHPLAAILDASRGPIEDTFVLIVGDPFTPRFEGPAPSADRSLAAGAPLAEGDVTGRHLDVLLVRDAAGRVRAPRILGGRPTVPAGLAGPLVLVAEAPGGVAELALGRAAIAVARVVPDRVVAGAGPVVVEVDGVGFHPGESVDLGGAIVKVPDDATPERFVVTLDSDALAPTTATGLPLSIVGAPRITAGPSTIHGGSSAVFATPDATADMIVTADTGTAMIPVPVRLATRDAVVVDTSPLPAGTLTLVFENVAGATERTLTVTRAAPSWTRAITFASSDTTTRQIYLSTAHELMNGETIANGEFWRYDTLILGLNGYYCPLDIRPETAVIEEPCTHFSGVCNDKWAWDDTVDPGSWFTVTPPPGRKTTGAERCPPVPGPASWSDVARADLYDVLDTRAAVNLEGQILRGPNAELVLPEARGGGLTVLPPLPEVAPPETAGEPARSNVVLDLIIEDAVTVDRPIVALDGVVGVTIRRLEIRGRAGSCDVGLRIRDSRDVHIESLRVRDCDIGLEIVGSEDIRVGSTAAPVYVTRAATGVKVLDSRDVFVHATIGLWPLAAGFQVAAAGTQDDGVVVQASERVTVAGTIVATPGDAVRFDGVTDGRIGPLGVGFAKGLDDVVLTTGTGVGTGVVLEAAAGAQRRVVVAGVEVDQTSGDGIVVRGGSDIVVTDSQVGALLGAIGGVGLRAGFGFVHDVRFDGVAVAGTAAEGVHVTGEGRVDVRRVVVSMDSAEACGFLATSASGVRMSDTSITGRWCSYLTTDVRAADVVATEVALSQSADLHLERFATRRVTVDGGAGLVLRTLDAGDVHVNGPLAVQLDPIVISGGTLAASDAVVATDTRVPLIVDLAAERVTATRHGGLTIAGGNVGQLALEGPGRTRIGAGANVDVVVIDGGELVVEGGVGSLTTAGEAVIGARVATIGGTLVADGGRVALVATEVTGDVDVRDTTLAVAGGTFGSIVAEGGSVRVSNATVTRDVALYEVAAPSIVDSTIAGDVIVDGGARGVIARVGAAAIERRGSARELRVVASGPLASSAGDPRALARQAGDAVVVTAAPEHALVELLRAGPLPVEVVGRALASGGQVVFADVGPGPFTLQTTLLDGATGPATTLAATTTETCGGDPAPSEITSLVEATADCPDAPADVIASPDCRLGARIDDGSLVIVDLASGVESTLGDGGAEVRWPAWEADASALWLSRREAGDAPWELARVDLTSGTVTPTLALAGDAAWPAPSPDGAKVAFALCPTGEDGVCHIGLLDVATGAASVPARAGWPAAEACDDRRPRWLGDSAAAALGEALVVERRARDARDGGGDLDLVSPLGLVRYRLGPAL